VKTDCAEFFIQRRTKSRSCAALRHARTQISALRGAKQNRRALARRF
jgi:hypothetical protein